MTRSELDDAAVYAEHAPRLVALATALAGPSSAEDVVSAAVVRVLSSPSWPEVADRGAYLTRAVVNVGAATITYQSGDGAPIAFDLVPIDGMEQVVAYGGYVPDVGDAPYRWEVKDGTGQVIESGTRVP